MADSEWQIDGTKKNYFWLLAGGWWQIGNFEVWSSEFGILRIGWPRE